VPAPSPLCRVDTQTSSQGRHKVLACCQVVDQKQICSDQSCLPHGVERADRAKPASHRLQFGYTVYRRVLGYYSGEEDALDMRKAMPRDVAKRSVVPLKRPVRPEDLECD